MKNIAVITGASSGLGKEFTKQIASSYNFDEIWIIARRQELLIELAQEINSKKQTELVRSYSMDISGKQGALNFKNLLKSERDKRLKEDFSIGLLINNAGFGTYGPFDETSVEREMDMIELNCTSLTGFCGYALPFLKENSVIINTASLAAFLPLGNFAVYAATKSYVLSFSIALAAELKDKKIKVCALCPGSVSTEFANVASEGVRKEVKGGIGTEKVVHQCLIRAFKGKHTSLYRLKWRFTAFMSRFVGRYAGARYTYKFNKRPHIQVKPEV